MKRLPHSAVVVVRHRIKQINTTGYSIFFFRKLISFFILFKNMQMRVMIFTLGGICLMLSMGCKKGGRCEESPNIYQSEVVVDFKDNATGKYLYSETFPPLRQGQFEST